MTLYTGVGVVNVGVTEDPLAVVSTAVVVVALAVADGDDDDSNVVVVELDAVCSFIAHGDDGVCESGTGEMSGGEMVL